MLEQQLRTQWRTDAINATRQTPKDKPVTMEIERDEVKDTSESYLHIDLVQITRRTWNIMVKQMEDLKKQQTVMKEKYEEVRKK